MSLESKQDLTDKDPVLAKCWHTLRARFVFIELCSLMALYFSDSRILVACSSLGRFCLGPLSPSAICEKIVTQ